LLNPLLGTVSERRSAAGDRSGIGSGENNPRVATEGTEFTEEGKIGTGYGIDMNRTTISR
jgi:hypothetical protein